MNGSRPCNEILFNHEENEVLIHATPWMNLENTALSKRSQLLSDHILLFHLFENPGEETESKLVIA